jgi:hypothetical protein
VDFLKKEFWLELLLKLNVYSSINKTNYEVLW